MELHVQISGATDLSGQVYRQIAAAIGDGRLRHGQQLPPSRLLAGQLGISRKPVADAYARLTYERLIVGHIGKGSFVSGGGAAPAIDPAGDALAANRTLAHWRGLETPLRHPMPEGSSWRRSTCSTGTRRRRCNTRWRTSSMVACCSSISGVATASIPPGATS